MGVFLDRKPDPPLHVYVPVRDRRDVSEVRLGESAVREKTI